MRDIPEKTPLLFGTASVIARCGICRRTPRLVALSLAVCALLLATQAPAREVDDRPLLFAMLKSLEQQFGSYQDWLEREHAQALALLEEDRARHQTDLAARQRGEATRQAHRYAELKAQAKALNVRAQALNERIGSLQLSRNQLTGATSNDTSLVLATEQRALSLRTAQELQTQYRERAVDLNRRQRALRSLADAIEAGSHPRQLRMKQLKDDFNHFKEQVESTLAALARAELDERREHQRWVDDQNRAISELRRHGDGLKNAYQGDKARHDALAAALDPKIVRYNALANDLNQGHLEDDARTTGIAQIKRLGSDIDAGRKELARLRDATLTHAAQLRAHAKKAETASRQVVREKEARELALREQANARRKQAADLDRELDERRRQTLAGIEAQKAGLTANLADTQADQARAQVALTDHYGKEHARVYELVADWIGGAPAADLLAMTATTQTASAPGGLAALRAAITEVAEAETAIQTELARLTRVGEAGAALASAYNEVEALRKQTQAERQRLAAANTALVAQGEQVKRQLQGAADEARAAFESRARSLEEFFEARQSLSLFEFEVLQRSLLDTAGTDHSPTQHRDTTELEHRLVKAAAGAGIANPDPYRFAAFVHAGGISSGDGTKFTHGSASAPWVAYLYQPTRMQRELTADDKTALANWWWRQLLGGDTEPLPSLRQAIIDAGGSRAESLYELLEPLFILGVREVSAVYRHELESNDIAYRVVILNQTYWLRPDGRLEYVPTL